MMISAANRRTSILSKRRSSQSGEFWGDRSLRKTTIKEKKITRSGILICLIQHQLTRLLNLPPTVGPKTLPIASGMAKSSIYSGHFYSIDMLV